MLPKCVKALLQSESVKGQTYIMLASKGNMKHTNNLGRAMVLKKFDETGSTEARAVEKVLS